MARSQAADGISRLSTARRFAGSPRRTYLAGVDGAAAIDAGKNVGCPATDQRAAPRPFDGDGESVCDVGAFAVSDIVFSDGFESGDTGAWSFTSGALAPGVPEIKSPR